jgi:hypothetical protein
VPAGLCTVALGAGLTLLPVAGDVLDRVDAAAVRPRPSRGTRAGCSTGPRERATLRRTFEPGYHLAPHDSAVNAGLRAIGVRAADGRDEYGTAGLSRHRMTGDWLPAAAP